MKKVTPSQNKSKIQKALLGQSDESLCAHNLKYEYVYDNKLKKIRKVKDIIGKDLDYVFHQRSKPYYSADDKCTQFCCMSCKTPLTLRSTLEQSGFYFKHSQNSIDCPLKDEDNLPPHILRARKFKGNQESKAHFYMKHLLYNLLENDTRFSNIKVENIEKNSLGEWRKPDVSAEFQGKKFAFEIQLSTELLSTIVARRKFYIDKGILLVWIFQKFSFEKARISDLDILYSNNNNILILDEESVDKSVETHFLHLSCCWREAYIGNDNIIYKQNEGTFDFQVFHKDFEKSHIFYHDFSTNNKFAKDRLFYKLMEKNDDTANNISAINILNKCYNTSIVSNYKKTAKLIYAVLVAKTSKMCGWRYKELVQVFDLLLESHKEITYIFMVACELYDCKFDLKHNRDNQKNKVIKSLTLSMQQVKSPYIPTDKDAESIGAILECAFPDLYIAFKNKLQTL